MEGNKSDDREGVAEEGKDDERTEEEREGPLTDDELVDETSKESMPASDPPAW